jgi:hypothetical protein
MIFDYALRLFCTLVITAFLYLVGGVLVCTLLQVHVVLPLEGLLTLWALAFVAFELMGVWKGGADND